MTVEEIFKKSKWALGKETPKKIYVGTNFNPGSNFPEGLIKKIDSIPIYLDPKLKGQKVKVKGKKKEVIIDLATIKRHKLIKVR